jgi:predicted aspartyl protease
LVASVDTGAAYCLFAGQLAERLGLDLTSGEPKRFRTANSSLESPYSDYELSRSD